MDASDYFRGKKVTVMGLGLLGRGVGDIAYLAECGADLIVTDPKPAEVLTSSLEELSAFPNIKFVLGEHRLGDFRDRDLVIKVAGAPMDSPYIIEAENAGIPVKMSTSLFVELAQIPVIGITGTRGKSTVTYMIHSILQEAGQKVLLGGNIRGVSTLALLPEVTPEHVAVLELDSWQLQGFGNEQMSPSIAVFTTFYPDHLNYYKDDLGAYLADKANIFFYQGPEDTFILGSQAAPLVIEKYGEAIDSQIKIVDGKNLPAEWKLSIPGDHNRYNAALALAAARVLDVDDLVSQHALESFKGVPGRLELVTTLDGVSIYNDTNATTPDATIAALTALAPRGTDAKSILLIMGGADKGLDMDALLGAIPQYAKRVMLLSGTGTERIRESLPEAEIYENLAMAFADAHAHAQPGDIILFSPAFASFGMFKNEYDRGDQFVSLVNSYES